MNRRARRLAIFVFATTMPLACGDGADGPSADTDEGSGTNADTGTDGVDDAPGSDAASAEGDSTGAPATCGDGVVDEGEVCDDGEDNGMPGKCSAACDGTPVCGDGQVDSGEACDDGQANGDYGACAADCSGPGPSCGDGTVDEGQEECDDANATDGDGCNADCVLGGKLLDTWTIDASTGGPDEGRAIGVLSGGRFGVSGRAGSTGVPMFFAFEGSDPEPFFSFGEVSYRTQAGQSISELPDGRVLWTAPGYDSSDQGIALRYWFDLERGTETHHHVAIEAYPLRSAALPDGGHVLCSNAEAFGLSYFGGSDVEFSDWEGSGGCHAVAVDGARVVQLKGLPDGPVGPWLVELDAYDHLGLPTAHVEYYQGVGTANAVGLALDSAHNMIVAGSFVPSKKVSSNLRPMLRKYDPSGDLVWSKSPFRTTRSEWASVAVDQSDNIVTAGLVYSGIVEHGLLRKFSPEGDEIWSWEADELDGQTRFEAITVDADGSILAAGTQTTAGDESDIVVVRLSP